MKNEGTPETMGTTPGCASTARRGSPKAPGMLRTSLVAIVTEPGTRRAPWTTTSSGSSGPALAVEEGLAPAPGVAPSESLRAPEGSEGGDAKFLSREGSKRSVYRIRAATGRPSRRRGRNARPAPRRGQPRRTAPPRGRLRRHGPVDAHRHLGDRRTGDAFGVFDRRESGLGWRERGALASRRALRRLGVVAGGKFLCAQGAWEQHRPYGGHGGDRHRENTSGPGLQRKPGRSRP